MKTSRDCLKTDKLFFERMSIICIPYDISVVLLFFFYFFYRNVHDVHLSKNLRGS